jgi:hypothetical protein
MTIDGVTYKVLARVRKHGVSLKMVKGNPPKDAPNWDHEAVVIEGDPEKKCQFLQGGVIRQ